jgi:hypothetical protein
VRLQEGVARVVNAFTTSMSLKAIYQEDSSDMNFVRYKLSFSVRNLEMDHCLEDKSSTASI